MEQQVDLFGNVVEEKKSLKEIYGEKPFTVLNSSDGRWQARKNRWKNLGIQSEVGRDVKTFNTNMNGNPSTNTSVFDPVLTELIYRWFAPPMAVF